MALAARAGDGQALVDALHVPAQPAALQQARQRPLVERRAGQLLDQLALGEAVHQRLWTGQVADPQTGADQLGKAADAQRAPQAIECRQARQVGGGEAPVGVVLDDQTVARLGQTQQLVRLRQRQAVAGRVVQHIDGQVEARPVLLQQRRQHRQVRSLRGARHGQRAQAELGQACEVDRPAGVVDQHRVARLHQGLRHQVERLGGAAGQQDLLGQAGDAELGLLLGQLFAQQPVALRVAVAQQQPRVVLGQRLAQRLAQGRGVEPVGRQGAVRRGRGVPAAHQPAHQGQRVEGRRLQHRQRGARGGPGTGATRLAHEEAALGAGLDQAERLQAVVGGHQGGRADALLARALAHRGQAAAGQQQALLDALREALRQRLGASTARLCVARIIHTDPLFDRSSVLLLYW